MCLLLKHYPALDMKVVPYSYVQYLKLPQGSMKKKKQQQQTKKQKRENSTAALFSEFRCVTNWSKGSNTYIYLHHY